MGAGECQTPVEIVEPGNVAKRNRKNKQPRMQNAHEAVEIQTVLFGINDLSNESTFV